MRPLGRRKTQRNPGKNPGGEERTPPGPRTIRRGVKVDLCPGSRTTRCRGPEIHPHNQSRSRTARRRLSGSLSPMLKIGRVWCMEFGDVQLLHYLRIVPFLFHWNIWGLYIILYC